MTTKRLLILQVLLLGGLSLVFLLPKHFERPAAGVTLELPAGLGLWYGDEMDVTQRERDVLGPETQFARRRYDNALGTRIDVSVVLSGEDMNTSIHRPERCLPAQGFSIVQANRRTLQLGAQTLTVTRLHTTHPIPKTDEHPAYTEHSLYYYWFIGSTETTPSHTTREIIDIRDRIFKGTVQRWAYITLRSPITKNVEKFGHSEQELDKTIAQFIQILIPKIQKPSVVIR